MLDLIKKLTIKGLLQDEKLMYGLVLKGGNALQLVYHMTDRASMDIDFSIEGDFSEQDIKRIKSTLEANLNQQFQSHDLIVFDIDFFEKPKQNKVKEWKGYSLEFKVANNKNYYPDNIEKTRREAIKLVGQSPKFSVDISSFEYVATATTTEVDGTVLNVYTPEMIVFEKLRALCQSIPEYQNIISSANVKGRARDYYDIWNICQHYNIDFTSKQNISLLQDIFNAKRVPIDFLDIIGQYRDLQEQNWISVEDTLSAENEGFEFYFDFVMNIVSIIRSR